jgi:hypothetical protein
MKPFMAFSLQLVSQRKLFDKVADEVRLAMEDVITKTTVRTHAFKMNGEKVSEMDVPDRDIGPNEDIIVMGYLEGPDIGEGPQNAMDTEWGKLMTAILESNGVQYQGEVVN